MFNTNIKSVVDLLLQFPTEQSCIDYLEQIIWAGEVVSPYDKNSKVYKLKNNYYKCKTTGKRFNIKTGTIYENSPLPLRKWFMAMWLVTTHKKGLASTQLAEQLDVTQKTAWFMLMRIRKGLGMENCNELEGVVEMDEAVIGGKNKNRHKNKRFTNIGGRSTVDKDAVFGMVQRNGKLVAIAVPDCNRETLQPIIKTLVAPGSTVITDNYVGYHGLESDYEHRIVKDVEKGYYHEYDAETHTNNIEGSWKIIKNSVHWMYNHVQTKHLQKYLDEAVYRYNTRQLPNSDKFNYSIANSGVRTRYKDLINEKAFANFE